jgi:trans-aconitate 2-methyltransferase
MAWNPQQYLQFEGERLRPALDLLARVPLHAPGIVVDLGCGAGNVTRVLAQRWPDAKVIGVDNSDAMLAKARVACTDLPRVEFIRADLATWQPAAPVDVIYSNAAMQWIDDHAALFPRVAAMVRAGGTLAVQMPDNHHAPSHRASVELARSVAWSAKLAGVVRSTPVAAATSYFEWLSPRARSVDIWSTEYLQVLPVRSDGEHPVVAWTRGTWLVPFLSALDDNDQKSFLEAYATQMAIAYPPSADGRTLFPFRRLFIVANR